MVTTTVVHNQSDCKYLLLDKEKETFSRNKKHFLDEEVSLISMNDEKVKALMLKYMVLGFLFCGNCQAAEHNNKRNND